MNVPKLRFKDDDGREFLEWKENWVIYAPRLSDMVHPILAGRGWIQSKLKNGSPGTQDRF